MYTRHNKIFSGFIQPIPSRVECVTHHLPPRNARSLFNRASNTVHRRRQAPSLLCNDLRAQLSEFSFAPALLPRAAGAQALQIVNRK